RQPGGFEALALEPESMEGSAQSQVILDTKEAAVSQPEAVVQLALKIDSTPAALGPQVCGGQDSIIANCDQRTDLPVVARKRIFKLDEELRNLLQTVAGSRLRELAHRVVIGVGIPELHDGGPYLVCASG